MAPRCEVRLKNTAGVTIAIFTNWRRLEYTKRVNSPHSHVLILDGSIILPGGVAIAAAFVVDAQIEVWRWDIAAFPAIPHYLEYEGFHRTAADQTTERGESLFTSYGRGYLDLLARREILYPAGSAGAEKSGPGETVLKAYIDDNAGPSATFPPRLLASGVTSGLTVEADAGAGTAWTGARAYRNLLEVAQEIAKATGIDFEVVGTGPGTFDVRARATPLGADRSTVGLDPVSGLNGAGNAPVIFALGAGNMSAPILSQSRTEEANAVIVLGQGLEAGREVVQRIDGAAMAASPWNRREVTRNANMENTAAGLNAVGDALLEDLAARETFGFQVLQIPSLLYGRDYFLGDRVTARYKSVERHYQILEVTVTVESGQETITVGVANVES